MEQMDLDNLSKDEMFKVIKDKCKSRARVHIYIGLAVLLLLVAFMIESIFYFRGSHHLKPTQIIAFVSLVILTCFVAWLLLNNYRFLKKIGSLDNPDQLLYRYEKKLRNERLLYFISILLFLFDQTYSFIYHSRDDGTLFFTLFIIIALVAFIAIYWYNGLKDETFKFSRRDVEIIERLQELTEK